MTLQNQITQRESWLGKVQDKLSVDTIVSDHKQWIWRDGECFKAENREVS